MDRRNFSLDRLFSWSVTLLILLPFLLILGATQDVRGQPEPVSYISVWVSFPEPPYMGLAAANSTLEVSPMLSTAVEGDWVAWTCSPLLSLDPYATVTIQFDTNNPFTPGQAWERTLGGDQPEVRERVRATSLGYYSYTITISAREVLRSWLSDTVSASLLVLEPQVETEEVVPPYIYIAIGAGIPAALGLGYVVSVSFLRSGFHSVAQRLRDIEKMGQPSPPTRLESPEDVEKKLQTIKESVSKLNDALKRLKSAKDEEEVVDSLVEFVEQIRSSSDDVGSFTEYLSQKAAPIKKRELDWFDFLRENLTQIDHALDSAIITIRPYASRAPLFEPLKREYLSLVSGAYDTQKAFKLADMGQVSSALKALKDAKSRLDRTLNDVSQGLADWYKRLKWVKYFH